MSDEEHDFDEIWRHVAPTLWRALYAYAGGRGEIADDALVEAFARAIERASEIRDARAYLFRVGFRLAAAELRRDRGGELVDLGVEDAHEPRDLLVALRTLSPSQRAAVYLYYAADLPVREVAQLMGTSAAAVKVHLMRGRRRLAAMLGEEDVDG